MGSGNRVSLRLRQQRDKWVYCVTLVSAKGRSLPQENYVPFIQTDVAINPAIPAGAVQHEGEVVGVNSQIYAVPVVSWAFLRDSHRSWRWIFRTS